MARKRGPKKVTKTILKWDLSHQPTKTKYGYSDRQIFLNSVTIWLLNGVAEMFVDFTSKANIDPNDHIRIQEDVNKLVGTGNYFFWRSRYHCSNNSHNATICFRAQNGIDFSVTAIEKFIEIYKYFGCKQAWVLKFPSGTEKEMVSRPLFPTITQETYVVSNIRTNHGKNLLEPYNLHVSIPLYREHFPELCRDLANYETA